MIDTYKRFKPVVIPVLFQSQDLDGIQADVDEVVRSFRLPVPDALRAESAEVSKLYDIFLATLDINEKVDLFAPHYWSDVMRWLVEEGGYEPPFEYVEWYNASNLFEEHAHAAGFDAYLLQWRLRREAEGGPELVEAWATVFADISLTLAWSRADTLWQEAVQDAQAAARERKAKEQ